VRSGGKRQQAQAFGDPGVTLERGTDQGELPTVTRGELTEQLDAVNVAGEGRDEDTPRCARHERFDRRGHGALAGGRPGTVGVGAVGQHDQHPLPTEARQALAVRADAVHRIGIELEVGSV